jgi:hypothetical protein
MGNWLCRRRTTREVRRLSYCLYVNLYGVLLILPHPQSGDANVECGPNLDKYGTLVMTQQDGESS